MDVNNKIIEKLAVRIANLEIAIAETQSKNEMLVQENKSLIQQIEALHNKESNN